MSATRLDKWLWAARFYKTRSLAQEAIAKGRVQLRFGDHWQAAKPGREVHEGELLRVTAGSVTRDVVLRALSTQRGPATAAQALYEETPESLARREKEAAARQLAPPPGSEAGWHDGKGRPTKRDRRALQRARLRSSSTPFDW